MSFSEEQERRDAMVFGLKKEKNSIEATGFEGADLP